jgi:hypothetical protein
MEYPVVVVTKKGRGMLLVSETQAIHVAEEDGLIEYTEDIPKDLRYTDFPVSVYANHLAAGTCHHPYETAVVRGLQTCYENFLMPVYCSKEQCQKLLNSMARPVAASVFFPFWAPPKLEQESEDMATKKASAAKPAATKAVKKAAPAAKATKKAAAPAEGAKKRGVGAFCKELIVKGKTNDEILEALAKEFPDANTSKGSLAFYRNAVKAGK